MADNSLPTGINDLFQLAGNMETGLARHGQWLLKGAVTASDFSRLLGAAHAAESAWMEARAAKAEAGERFATADKTLTAWLAKARLVVMLANGNKYSAKWVKAGFTDGGTNVPKRVGARMELGRRVAEFFTAQRQYEVPFAQVTAAAALRLHEEIVAAEREVLRYKQYALEKRRSRDTAEKALRRKMHLVVTLLSCVIAPTDPRWLPFGLRQHTGEKRWAGLPQPIAGPAPEPLEVDFSTSRDPARESAVAIC